MINNLLRSLALMKTPHLLLLMIFLGVGYYFTLFDSGLAQSSRISALQAEMQNEENQLLESEKIAKELSTLEPEVATLKKKLEENIKLFSGTIVMPEFIRYVDNIAKISGVSIKEKEPKASVMIGQLEQIPVKVKIQGEFSALGLFLFQMAASPKVYNFSDFNLNSDGANRNLTLDLEIYSYSLKEEKKP